MKLRVWHIPQVPMEPFYVEVSSVEEGARMINALADYDLFQFEKNIKPDYCNMNGLEMWDENLSEEDMRDMELSDKWVEWYDDEHEDIREYVNNFNQNAETAA